MFVFEQVPDDAMLQAVLGHFRGETWAGIIFFRKSSLSIGTMER